MYLSSAELAAVCSILGKIPTVEEYMQYAGILDKSSADTYRYLNFDQLDNYQKKAEQVSEEA